MQKILVVDDNPENFGAVEVALEQAGYYVAKTHAGNNVLDDAYYDMPDLFLVDVSSSGTNVARLCETLRTGLSASYAPIIFLDDSESIYTVDQILDSGGDDYIQKPFSFRVLLARIRAHLRRSQSGRDEVLIQLFPDTHSICINDREVTLTRVEFDLFRFLCQTPEKLYTANDLLENVWQYPSGVGDVALVRNHIRNLRYKIEENPDYPLIVQSRHGRGYMVRGRIRTPHEG